MPDYTTNLNLFKYDPATDGESTFNITNALNNNWDTLDSKVHGDASLTSSGYQKFASGLILQWGTYTGTIESGTLTDIYFPLEFPNACFGAYPTVITADPENGVLTLQAKNFSTTKYQVNYHDPDSDLLSFTWFAIGF